MTGRHRVSSRTTCVKSKGILVVAPAIQRVKTSFGGTIAGQAWETSMWWSQSAPGLPLASDLLAFAAGVGSAFNTHMGAPWRSKNYSTTIWDSVRADIYLASSNASAQNATSGGFGVAGTAASVSAASQALCVSLYTAENSRRGRGRMYWPATGNLGAGFQSYAFVDADIQTYVSDFAAFLNAVTAANPWPTMGSVTPVVQSLTAGAVYPITTVLSDTRPDRIEHREKHLGWSRYSTALT